MVGDGDGCFGRSVGFGEILGQSCELFVSRVEGECKILAIVCQRNSPDGVLDVGDLCVLEKDEDCCVFGGSLQEGDGDDTMDSVERRTNDNIRCWDGRRVRGG